MKKSSFFLTGMFLAFACCGAAGCSGGGNTQGGSVPPDYTAKAEYDLTEFSREKYVSPIWQGIVSYAEGAFVMENEAGAIEPIALLYPVKYVVSVRSADLKIKYEEGRDYEVTPDGKLNILRDGTIPVLPYSQYYHKEYSPDGLKTQIPAAASMGAYLVAETTKQSAGMSAWCLAVTYTHEETQAVAKPADKSSAFARFLGKLQRGEQVKAAFFGDSITDGWGSTAFSLVDRAPYCPMYADLAMDALEQKYGVKIERKNHSVSGNTALQSYESENMDKVCAEQADLVVVAFGMNDGVERTPAEFADTIARIVNKINKQSPQSDIAVVLSMLPNEKVGYAQGTTLRKYQEGYPAEILKLEEKWRGAEKPVAAVNVTEVHQQMLQRKRFQDTTSSNTNHPNDYMHRVYAQTLLRTIAGDACF